MLVRERCYIPKLQALKKATKYIGLFGKSLWSTSPKILVTLVRAAAGAGIAEADIAEAGYSRGGGRGGGTGVGDRDGGGRAPAARAAAIAITTYMR